MRKIGLPCFTRSAAATSASAATASNLYSASIKGTSYLRSRSEKDRVDLQIVGDDLLADFQGKVSLIEGDGDAIGEAQTTDSGDALALGQNGVDWPRSYRQLQFL